MSTSGFTPIVWRYDRSQDPDSPITIEACRQRDGSTLYAVRLSRSCLNRDGKFEFEPMPSSRDDEFMARCRFPNWAFAAGMITSYAADGKGLMLTQAELQRLLALPAGRELDAAVAEHGLGRHVEYILKVPDETGPDDTAPLGFRSNFGGAVFTSDHEWLVDDWLDVKENREVKHYSTDIAAAGDVLQAMLDRGYKDQKLHRTGDQWFVLFVRGSIGEHEIGDTLPLAVCRAALNTIAQETPCPS